MIALWIILGCLGLLAICLTAAYIVVGRAGGYSDPFERDRDYEDN